MDIRSHRRRGGPVASKRNPGLGDEAYPGFRYSAQAALHAKPGAKALPSPRIALKLSTPRPGRSAGGVDARTARKRE
jgi:hypothetical protein